VVLCTRILVKRAVDADARGPALTEERKMAVQQLDPIESATNAEDTADGLGDDPGAAVAASVVQ